MELRQLGTTGLTVPRLGLGMAALGRPGYITIGHADDLARSRDVDALRARSHTLLDEAWRLGVRYFDAARSYGRAEAFLGEWLRDRNILPGSVVVGSKWGYTYTAGWQIDVEQHEVKDHTLATLERQQRESRELLDLWLRLYQIHSATESSGVLERPDVLARLAQLRAETGVRIGLTLSGTDSQRVLERALTCTHDGVRLFDTVQATWNILEPSLGHDLASAHAGGVGVIVKEALANGRLTERNQDAAFAKQRGVLIHEAARLGCDIDQLALAMVLDQPWADCVLSGAATIPHLRSNVAALDVVLDDYARAALATLAESPDTYWSTRSALRWN